MPLRGQMLLARAPCALVGADARSHALLPLAPLAVMLAHVAFLELVALAAMLALRAGIPVECCSSGSRAFNSPVSLKSVSSATRFAPCDFNPVLSLLRVPSSLADSDDKFALKPC